MTRRGVLQESEREYLNWRGWRVGRNLHGYTEKTEREPPEIDVNKARWRIDNEVGGNLHEIIRHLNRDLRAIETFYRFGGGEWGEYADVYLPTARDELEALRDTVDEMIEYADRELEDETKERLREHLHILATDLDLVQKHVDGELGDAELEWDGFEIVGPPEFVEQEDELKERQKAVVMLLSRDGMMDIFRWVAENERDRNTDSKLEGKTRGNTQGTWKQAIGRYLKRDYSLVEESGWGYELTERGRVVYDCLMELKKSEVVEEERKSGETWVEGTHRLLSLKFGVEGW